MNNKNILRVLLWAPFGAGMHYWDSSLQWHEGEFNPQGWMVDGMIKEIK